jgi:SAM-dependent methyltransferase
METTSTKMSEELVSHQEFLTKIFSSYLKKEVDRKPSNIISIGCKFAYEAQPILSIFPTATFKGVDIDRDSLMVARKENENLKNVMFQQGDATKRETFGKDPWDIIIIRHPQVLGEAFPENKNRDLSKDWHIIIENSMEALRSGGLLFVSTTLPNERDMVLDYVNSSRQKMLIKLNKKNVFNTNMPFKDDFITIAKKG